jgi:hypothetical protein
MPGQSGFLFFWESPVWVARWKDLRLMAKRFTQARAIFCSAQCRWAQHALLILFACASLSFAQAQNSSDSSANKSTASKSSTQTSATSATTHKKVHHKTTHSTASGAAGSTSSKTASTHTTSAKGKTAPSRRKRVTRTRGQQKMDSDRVQSIQEALIRENYLKGEASGKWDAASEDAMRRYQNDHGWQTKEVPDSRALIKLGLGPSHDHLLNPESAMTTGPDAPHAAVSNPPAPTSEPVPVGNTPSANTTAPTTAPATVTGHDPDGSQSADPQ